MPAAGWKNMTADEIRLARDMHTRSAMTPTEIAEHFGRDRSVSTSRVPRIAPPRRGLPRFELFCRCCLVGRGWGRQFARAWPIPGGPFGRTMSWSVRAGRQAARGRGRRVKLPRGSAGRSLQVLHSVRALMSRS